MAEGNVHRSDQAEPAASGQSLLNEDDIFNIRILNDDRSSIVSTDSNQFEEVKTIGMKDSLVHDQMKEYQVHKGKVTSTYIMKAGADDSFSYFGSVNGDADLANSFDKRTLIISRIIKHQLNQETHPIRMIIHQFSISFVKAYQQFVNKSQTGSAKLYENLEQTNRKIYDQHENGASLEKLHRKKRLTEKSGDMKEAEKLKIPRYFLFNQVVGDIKLFIEQMKLAVIEFYTVVAKQQDLLDIEEVLYECLTDIILTGNLQKIVFAFFRLESEDRRDKLKEKYREYIDIQPQHVGIDEKFALNESSPIIEIYEYMMQMGQRINESFDRPTQFDKKQNYSLGVTSDDEDEFMNDYNIRINDDGDDEVSIGSHKSRRSLNGMLVSKSLNNIYRKTSNESFLEDTNVKICE